MPYPVTFKADYVEKRSRLTTFFRLMLAIPHFIAVISTSSPRRSSSSSRGSRCSSRAAIRRGCTTSSRARCGTRRASTATRPAHRRVPALLGRSGDDLPGRPDHRAAEGGVQPAEGPLPDHPRDPGAHHPVRDADRGPGGRVHRLVRDRGPRPPAQGPAGHDRAGAELPAARERLLGPADRGLAALHRRDDGPHRRGGAGVRRAGLQPTGRGSRAPDLGAARRLRLARARGGLPVPAARQPPAEPPTARRAARRRRPRRAVVHGRAGRVRRARAAGARAAGGGA